MSIDIIANFLTIIRNGIMASRSTVVAPFSKMKYEIARILLQEGFISAYRVVGEGIHKSIEVELKYVDGESVIHDIRRCSKPSRRVYSSIDTIKPVIGGLGISILSTNKGVLSHKQAKTANVGGEILCTVW